MDLLLTFVGKQDPWRRAGQAGPILSLVRERDFDRIVLFSNAGTLREAAETRDVLGHAKAEVKELPLKDPTDYISILAGLREHIGRITQTYPDAHYFIAGSSGTPQMQACSMLLVMSGRIDAKFLLVREPQFKGLVVREFDFTEPEFPKVAFWSREKEAGDLPESELLARARDAGIYGSHPALTDALKKAAAYARFDTDVLITGETGTGKELFARFIHQMSPRKSGAFRAFNCSAISEELADNELFGHTAGAYTGARGAQPGLFRDAAGGILFLDEVAEMSQRLQAKVLRAIEYKVVKPVGASNEEKVDVTLIFATNEDLWKSVENGRLRHDLFRRLYGDPVCIPPLRDRKSDIPELVSHFEEEFNTKFKTDVHLTEKAMNKLHEHEWPGNVRELSNLIRNVIITAEKPFLDADDIQIGPPTPRSDSLESLPEPYDGFSLDGLVTDVRKHYLQKALDMAGGQNKSAAARLLGMTPQNYHKQWKSYFG